MMTYYTGHNRRKGDRRRRFRVNGRRGSFLLLMGCLHVVLGLGYLLPMQTAPGPGSTIRFVLDMGFPLTFLGAVWIVSALIAWAAAFVRPPGKDGFGFASLVVMEAIWVGNYLATWVFSHHAHGREWLLAALFGALGFAVWVVSGMVSIGAVDRMKRADQDGR